MVAVGLTVALGASLAADANPFLRRRAITEQKNSGALLSP